MTHPRHLRIEDYDYALPEERIARFPLGQRDASRLLQYKEGHLTEHRYEQIDQLLEPDDLIVFNETRVIHARLLFVKSTGGTIEVFCLEPHSQYADIQTAMQQKGEVWWTCMIGGASKWKHGAVLSHTYEHFCLSAAIVERNTGSFTVALSWDNPTLSFAEVLHEAGQVPLPPYLHREAERADEERYQTIYAREEGSVAAPTAGLHFTEEVMKRLSLRGVAKGFVTLHVGAGTFKPVKSETMAEHEMHAEWIDVSLTLIEQLIAREGKRIIAVGTTSLRTLESLYWMGAKLLNHVVPDFQHLAVSQWEPYELQDEAPPMKHALQALADWMLQNHRTRLITRTQILIAPGYEFKVASGLVTNFHQPRSTLLLLIAAWTGDDWRKIYDYAISHQFRFLSYGDGSLLWRRVN